jgi:DNA-binding transcriptional MocR family regulator
MTWRPVVPRGGGPLYKRLVDVLASDIAAGRLATGARLPPQRGLAHALGIGVGTVTKAYEEAALRGLIEAHVGRGSFVAPAREASAGSAPDSSIDLSLALAPAAPAEKRLTEAISQLRRRSDLIERLALSPPEGCEADRRAGAAWLAHSAGFTALDWRSVICCAGAQMAMTFAFGALCKRGDEILCEAASFWGMKALAAHAGYKLTPVAMDAEGLLPQAVDRAAAAGARVLYTLPTLQNPTARVMGQARRAQIAKVARKRNLWIVEDDIYALYGRTMNIEPIAALAPERTFYIGGVSKSLAPGLRVGFLVPPAGAPFERVIGVIRALSYAPPGFANLIATQWIESGAAQEIAREVYEEVRARTQLARSLLDAVVEPPALPASLHLWAPMSELEAERVAGRALRGGVALMAPAASTIGNGKQTGLRLCLGAARDQDSLRRALTIFRAALLAEISDPARATI